MGWDARLECPHCGLKGDEGWTYTYNCSPMFAEALGRKITSLDGLTCLEAAEEMKRGVDAMEADPEKYRAMNPPNGWGDYESALATLREMLYACEEKPKAVFRIQ